MAEGARLESVYTATYRGFESPPHRHILRRARTQVRAFFSHVALTGVRQRATPVGQTASLRAGCPAGASEASQSPPHRHIRDESLYASTGSFLIYSPLGGGEPPPGVRQLTTDITQYCQSQTLLQTINSAAKMFANTIPSSALSHPA